jgi:hypothetical protein
VRAEIKRLRAQLDTARAAAQIQGSSHEVWELEKKMHDIFEKEEIMYRQRSRQDWLKAGDRNTKFFQNCCSHRRRKNTILGLRRDDGSVCKTNDGMCALAQNFYQSLYASEGSANAEGVLNLMGESANFVSLVFCVLDNNIRNFKCVLSGADFTAQEMTKTLALFQAG